MVEFNAQWYRRLVSKADEKAVLVSKIADIIGNGPYDACLEIGLGISPYFASVLSNKFRNYTILENRLVEVEMPPNVSLINANWELADIKMIPNVIIASHVLYYFDNKQAAVDKMFDSLADNGRVFFVVNGKDADYGPIKAAFSNELGIEYHFTYDELIGLLGKRKYIEQKAIIA